MVRILYKIPSENSQILDPDLEEAKKLINLSSRNEFKESMQQLIKDTFGENFDIKNLNEYSEKIKLELEEMEDLAFLLEDNLLQGENNGKNN